MSVKRSAQAIREFVLSLDLPETGPMFETAAVPEPPTFTGKQEVVAVGAQLTEFSDKVSAELRPLISNSMLLAQLAANKAAGDAATVLDWYGKYRDVLTNIGWATQSNEDRVQQVSNKNLGVHKAIIPVLTAMLGPAVAAASMIVAVLQGLNEMDSASPWITLFDRSSQHAHGAKFQISYVDADKQGEPVISLLACAIEADRTITQVLFFKFSAQKAELHTSATSLGTTASRLNTDKDAIESRVHSFISDFVKNIEI
jgi:hypothetical protein